MEEKSRINRAVLNMSIAFLISKRGTCKRAQVGAVITKNNRIISTGYNGALHNSPLNGNFACDYFDCDINKKCQHAVHAEVNAISAAAKLGIGLEGSSLFCTHEPCYECAKLIIQSGIKTVFYCHSYTTHHGLELLKEFNIDYLVIDYEQIQTYIKA